MISNNEIMETIEMISNQHLDVRTITLGISLFDCISENIDTMCRKVYDKITLSAKNLVKIGNDIGTEYGIPIVNKRVSITPASLISAANGGRLTKRRTR